MSASAQREEWERLSGLRALRAWASQHWPEVGLAALALLFSWGFITVSGFDGLYGQDAYGYYTYATEVRDSIARGRLPQPYYWPLGYPALARVPVVEPGHAHVRVDNGHVSGSFRSGSVREAVVPTYAGMGGGTWVRDTCHQLPPQEVCARLSHRRYEIQRRYYSALQSERRELDLEQRGIDARLANDCGTY